MIKSLTILFCCILLSLSIRAQSYLGLSTGIAKDVNDNHNETFYQIPVTLQWKPFWSHYNPFMMELNYDIPFTGSNTATAYTLNPSLPASVQLQEQVRPYVFTASIGMGWRTIIDKERNNILYFNVMAGVCNQYFRVNYKHYDETNYEILDPDVNSDLTSLVLIGEMAYKFHNNMIIMLRAQTPLIDQYNGSYPLSYKDVAPFQLSFGYNFYYNKGHIDVRRKHIDIRRKRRIRYDRY
jgi:hypothetical protein